MNPAHWPRLSRKLKKRSRAFVAWFYSDAAFNPKRPFPVRVNGAW